MTGRWSEWSGQYRGERMRIRSLPSEQQRDAKRNLRRNVRVKVQEYAEEVLLRRIMSTDHLEDELSWFWFNHFNVFSGKKGVGINVPDYQESVIRSNSKGKFSDLLLGVVTHPAMLMYLDNQRNRVGRVNENLARELLELHTLGVNGNYSQQDVTEVARLLTGFSVTPIKSPKFPLRVRSQVKQDGEFLFNPVQHDFGSKNVIGQTIAGTGFSEIETLTTLLTREAATARHIAEKLCLYFLGDNPPDDQVARTAKVFAETEGDISLTVASINLDARVGDEGTFKDPMRYVVSAVRLLSGGKRVTQANLMLHWLKSLGQQMYGCRTPDGYDLSGESWLSSGQLSQRFEVAQQMVKRMPRYLEDPFSAKELLESPAVEDVIRNLGVNSRQTYVKARRDSDRLALLISSPEFMFWQPRGGK